MILNLSHLDSGLLRPVSHSLAGLGVAVAYIAASDNRTGLAWLGEQRIAEDFCLSSESVRRGRRLCENAGILIDTGEKRGRCRVYRVNLIPLTSVGNRDSQTPTSACASTPQECGRFPTSGASDSPRQRVTIKDEQGRTAQQQQAAAGGNPSGEGEPDGEESPVTDPCPVMDALVIAGIGEPRRSQLARDLAGAFGDAGRAAAFVSQKRTWALENSKGGGVLISELQNEIDRLATVKRQRATAVVASPVRPAVPSASPPAAHDPALVAQLAEMTVEDAKKLGRAVTAGNKLLIDHVGVRDPRVVKGMGIGDLLLNELARQREARGSA